MIHLTTTKAALGKKAMNVGASVKFSEALKSNTETQRSKDAVIKTQKGTNIGPIFAIRGLLFNS